jgi:hypothetical protein
MYPFLLFIRKLIIWLGLAYFLSACSTGALPAFSPPEPTLVAEALVITPFPSLTPRPSETEEDLYILAAEDPQEPSPEAPALTLSPTFTPSVTPVPAFTPWSTQPTLPTLSPAQPLLLSERYALVPWTAGEAARMIALLQVQRDQVPFDELGNYAWEYFAAWKPLALAYQETILRFPEDQAAFEQRWAAAYALTQYGANPQAAQAYASLLAEAINEGKVSLDSLPTWFRQRQRPYLVVSQAQVLTHLELLSTELRMPGYSNAYLLNLQDGEQGGICLLLVEKNGRYQSHVVFSSLLAWNEPRLALKNITNCSPIDVDGDGWDEVLTSRYEGGILGATHLQIFSLNRLPPYPLPFGPEGRQVFQVGWGGYQGFEKQDGRDYLKYSIVPSTGCNLSVTGLSRWNGEWFEPDRITFDFRPAGDALAACMEFIKDFASRSIPAAADDLLDGAIRHWFRRTVALEDPEQLDELRTLKGLYLAYEGRVEASRGVFAALVASPTSSESSWIEPAREFLQVYHRPLDIYRACQSLTVCSYPVSSDGSLQACVDVELCDPRQALQALVLNLPAASLPNAVDQLQKWGVPVQTSGFIDMDGDGLRETWFTLRHPGGRDPEVWAVVRWGDRLKALRFEGAPLPMDTIRRFETSDGGLVLINGVKQYSFKRLESNGEPFLLPVAPFPDIDPTQLALNSFEDLREALYSGTQPDVVLESLLELEKWRRFQCVPGLDPITSNYCPDYLYTLGLSAELAGYEEFAVQSYHRLWRDYPGSLYGLMARLKLQELVGVDG